jgi:predicted alpha/beta-hydrolase family hydrolase
MAKKAGMGAQYTRERIAIDDTNAVSAVLHAPTGDGPQVALAFAHGAGANMDQAVNVRVAEALAARGVLVMRFNFLYKEKGRGAPDRPPVLVETFRKAAAWLAARPEARGRALVLGGKSMGGRIASHLAALGDPCDGLWFLGYPLHPAGQPEKLRDAHLPDAPCPMLFLEGTRDPLCDLDLLRPVLARIGPRATLHVIEGGDHSFAVPKSLGRSAAEVEAELVEASLAWFTSAVTTPRAAASPAPSAASPRAGTTRRGSGSAPRR